MKIGDKVKVKINKQIGVIINSLSIEDKYQYTVFHNENNIQTYYEEQLEYVNEMVNNDIVILDDLLRIYVTTKMKMNSNSTIYSLNTGKIKFIPFQFRPLTKIINSDHNKILIADEVGVGKTIETGLILKEFEKEKVYRV